jgi:hypothetical protein
MHERSGGVRLILTKLKILLVFCSGILVLGWALTSESGIPSKEEASRAMGFARMASRDIPKPQLQPKANREFAQKGGSESKQPAQGSVIINGVRLSDEKVKTLEKQYGIRILNGDYWYDKMCGAWGFRGGPAVGLITPFLDLGGPLQPNASNGNTGVFFNGRELHRSDVLALQQITPVFQGRYWVNARGDIGIEGGPALANLWVLANSRGVKREGILSTYDKTGIAVFGY